MPELPEVQTIVDYLNKKVLDQKIIDIQVNLFKILKNTDVNEFKKNLLNQKIIKIERKGKYLLFFLTNQKVLSVHLRMEGKFFYQPKEEWFNLAHTHIIIEFDNKMQLRYNDTRQFGTFHIYDLSDYQNQKELKKLALDPLDLKFKWQDLYEKLKTSSRVIKTALLDQTNVAGIGNIYADEILFASKINPMKKASELTKKDYELIAKNAKEILSKAIENKGTTIHTYKFDNESTGVFQAFLKVHTKQKQPCANCKTIIEKTKVNGRGTYYCPKCQK